MEILNYRFEHGRLRVAPEARLVGVVSSGNLEVLIEQLDLGGACEVRSRPRRMDSAPSGRR